MGVVTKLYSQFKAPKHTRLLGHCQVSAATVAICEPRVMGVCIAAEILQMIEAKLVEDDHEPRNVLVLLDLLTPSSRIVLEDSSGEFMKSSLTKSRRSGSKSGKEVVKGSP